MNDIMTNIVTEVTLSLYAFHLRESLIEGINKPIDNAYDLWYKIDEIIKDNGINELDNLPKLISENEKSKQPNQDGRIIKNNNKFKTKRNNLDLQITLNPLKIHDTYAVDLTFSYLHSEVKLSDLSGLNLNKSLLPKNVNASLGQTLIFFARPIDKIEDEKALQDFADACVTSLLSQQKKKELQIYCQNKGKLLGNPIFEYNNDADSPEQQCHILVWLKTNPQSIQSETLRESYYPLMELLLCRSKIISVRNKAISCYQQARDKYPKLEKIVGDFNEIKNNDIASNLEKLQQWLIKLPDISFKYASDIRDLQTHKISIKTNIINYGLYLDTIKKLHDEDNLEFLSTFSQLAQNTYIQQIDIDLAYLTPANEVFKQMIETIRGILETEQAKRDRSLEHKVQVLAFALGGGAIVSGVIAEHIEKPLTGENLEKHLIPQQVERFFTWLPDFKYTLHPITSSLIWSLLATLFLLLIAKILFPKPKLK